MPFKNVVYEYPLSKAIEDGYTRTPYAVTRSDIDFYNFGDEQLDKMMLLDGITCHESTKRKLEVYEHIFLNTGIRYLDTGNRNKFVHGSSVRFLGLVEHPCCQRHFILLEGLSQILILSDLLFDCFYNLLCLHRGDRMRWGKANGYKQWKYLFIPSKQIMPNSSFMQLAKMFQTM